jgi:hypothetical protein
MGQYAKQRLASLNLESPYPCLIWAGAHPTKGRVFQQKPIHAGGENERKQHGYYRDKRPIAFSEKNAAEFAAGLES